MDLVGASQWAIYKGVINDGQDTFNQDEVIWKKSKGGLDRNVEDNKTEKFDYIVLKALAFYNAMRTWPITEYTETGAIDKESEVALFNIKYLRDLGWLDIAGNFLFDENTDRLIHKGIVWKSSGMTPLSQAQDEPLLIQMVLQKETIASQTYSKSANSLFYTNPGGSIIYNDSAGNVYITS